MKLRYCGRIESHFPVIFASESFVGEGTVTNVSVPGCGIISRRPVRAGSYLEMKVFLPDAGSPLSVYLARVRWCEENRFGVEFIRMPGDDQIRLGRLVRKQAHFPRHAQPQR